MLRCRPRRWKAPGQVAGAAAKQLREIAAGIVVVMRSSCKRSDIRVRAIAARVAAFADKMAPIDHPLNVIRQRASW